MSNSDYYIHFLLTLWVGFMGGFMTAVTIEVLGKSSARWLAKKLRRWTKEPRP